MAADDELFNLKNLYNLGCYQLAITEAMQAIPSGDGEIESKFFMYRAYIEQGQGHLVLSEVRPGAPPSLEAVKLLASYKSGNKEGAIEGIKELLGGAGAGNWHVLLMAGTIFVAEKDFKSALQHTHQNTQLEVMALVTSIYLVRSPPCSPPGARG